MSHIRSRFDKPPDELVIKYTSSLQYDWRLHSYDIRGSIAHARMLAKQGIISKDDAEQIEKGLALVAEEIEKGEFRFKPEQEDIHMAVEARLFELIGDTAGKLHTGRSRNDQVALDFRLYIKEAVSETLGSIRMLQNTLIKLAEDNKTVVMPGYTHLQIAQPVLLAHHLLAYFEMLERDYGRFKDCYKRTDVLPLGSGSLAGVTFNTDRQFLADELGFAEVSRNSMDAVSDRDFAIEYISAASICMMHLSRVAEEIILWSSAEFKFIELDDAYSTGSSLMPQKKNPDVAELGRGKAGRVYGNLMAMLTTMKGLPLTYNRDLQEDKERVFDTIDTLVPSLKVFSGMLDTLKFKPKNMKIALDRGFILATDLADYLVCKGETFRNAHGIIARLVSYAVKNNKTLENLSLDEYRQFSLFFEADIKNITVESSVAARDVTGGTSSKQVEKAIKRAKEIACNS
ncbi:MAG: argininosuccinate lyase [Dehalococcoidales bacterium]|nr:argininosuccinate lyase [Dehalococcoidales bacterium]